MTQGASWRKKPFSKSQQNSQRIEHSSLEALQGPTAERNMFSPLSGARDLTAWACKEICYKLGTTDLGLLLFMPTRRKRGEK